MLKSVNFLDETIFNYLGKDNVIIVKGLLDNFGENPFTDGSFWVQTDENGKILCVVICKEQETTILNGENADFEELKFILSDTVCSLCDYGKKVIDKIYLMHRFIENPQHNKGINYKEFYKITDLWKDRENVDSEAKSYRNLKGGCEGIALENQGVIAGGFISFSGGQSFISDVFTRENQRKKGYGNIVVNKLLSCSPNKNNYLFSDEQNRKFYENLGFKALKIIYKYEKADIVWQIFLKLVTE